MCDEQQVIQWGRAVLSRRRMGAIAIGGAAAACTPLRQAGGGSSSALAESSVTFAGPGGTMDGFFVHPARGRHPAVVLWPDVAGLREAKRQMARRLAASGYAVLVLNPYYRDVRGEQFADFPTFAAQGGFQTVKPWRDKLVASAIMQDAQAAAGWLTAQQAVDPERGIGNQGYCMGGPFTIWSASGVPRIRAAASFHGGGLVRDSETSPHRLLRADTHYLIAIAEDDDAKEPAAKTALRSAADAAGSRAEIEVYPAAHGWCVPDSPAYDEVQAERAWARLLALYSAAL